MIEIKGLTKKYGSKRAIDQVSFAIEEGEIVGLLGPNGAGKTTTMNILTGYISSSEGTVTVDGFDILKQPMEVKKRIGYLPENPPLYQDMTVLDYLSFVYDLKKATQPKEAHINSILNLIKIADVKHRLIKNLSKGYKQRVGIAQALIGDPPILIFDEPTVGLDPKQMTEIRSMIKTLGQKRTIILSSHILPEVSAVCERVIIINKGKIVASDSIEAITGGLQPSNILLARIEGPKDQVARVIQSVEGVTGIAFKPCKEQGAYDYEITTAGGQDVRKALSLALAQEQFPLLQLTTKASSLEDVFLQLTSKADQKGGGAE